MIKINNSILQWIINLISNSVSLSSNISISLSSSSNNRTTLKVTFRSRTIRMHNRINILPNKTSSLKLVSSLRPTFLIKITFRLSSVSSSNCINSRCSNNSRIINSRYSNSNNNKLTSFQPSSKLLKHNSKTINQCTKKLSTSLTWQ